ncbi:MAG: site-2 protease family protein [Candidatus Neomarinimicrobiota bacterium]|jgi:Zn-dependent protease|nr:site-2 protease family protein [Candidatus Neomarinimicrobiota bacterium]MEE3153744.1 site-2 protease family protein [Candidatus Neomarinimicrobiota bacterium]|tara:strand:+ start:1266 stop:1850 length:585 start_codon:yes stop_codon:yes gene_type:complete
MFALSFHEFAHAWMAEKCGDSTAARMGRLTLNPMAHLDMMGSLMILFVGFGWAKPVPVDGRNLRNPRTDMMKVAAAGPVSNLLLAMVAGMVLRFMNGTGLLTDSIFILLIYFTRINIALAVFNLIPVAPLDGSQIFSGYLMKTNPQLAWKIQTYGPQVLFGLILFGYFTGFSILWLVMEPFVSFFMLLFAGISM